MQISDLFEMALPSDVMRVQRFYHGVGSTAAAESIMREGLKGQETQGKSLLAPVKGRVYLSQKLTYAIIYALGGNYSHAMLEGALFLPDGTIDPNGYVFVVEGKNLVDVQPDEDSVGEFLSANSEPVQVPWKKPDGTIAMKNDGTPYMRTIHHRSSFINDPKGESIRSYISDNVTKNQYEKIVAGEYVYWAAGGKRVLKNMPDWMKIELINRGSHIAHGGAIHPSECWKIVKNHLNQLKKDGSNFFSIAERIM